MAIVKRHRQSDDPVVELSDEERKLIASNRDYREIRDRYGLPSD